MRFALPIHCPLSLNRHQYANRHLTRMGIAYVGLDNGLLTCDDPAQLPAIGDARSAQNEALAQKWLARLPQPFTAAHQAADYGYDISILQSGFSLTQLLDRPVTGRPLFEEIIRENLDLGCPDQLQLIINRRATRRTPGPAHRDHYQQCAQLQHRQAAA